MTAGRHLRLGALAFLVATGTRAPAQGLDASTFASFGGTYLTDTADSTAATAMVFADSLVVVRGDRRLVGAGLEPAWSYFGNAPPEGYVVALLATAPGDRKILGIVFEDSTGLFLSVDVYPEAPEADGATLTGLRFRRRGGPPPKAPSADPPTRTYELIELSAAGLLMDPQAKAALFEALGPLVEEPWLADLNGPSGQNRLVAVAGAEYLLASACMNHDCFENNVVLLYSAALRVVYGKVYRSGRSTFLGTPPPAVARELDRLWRQQFREN